MEQDTDAKLSRAAEAINAADALLVTAGAGMGVDSGLPDFRGAQGFWRAYPVLSKNSSKRVFTQLSCNSSLAVHRVDFDVGWRPLPATA